MECLIIQINQAEIKKIQMIFSMINNQKYNQKIADNVLDSECAALMIWLNKHCFNGLYRVNGKGLFNVPYNNKMKGKSIDENNIRAIGNYLHHSDITILCSDFEEACRDVRKDDFVYFDSPYIPESRTADFTAYAKNGFGMAEHVRLAELYQKLDRIGARLMLSNNDVELVRELYRGYRFTHLDVKRMINCDAARRVGKEVIVTNY